MQCEDTQHIAGGVGQRLLNFTSMVVLSLDFRQRKKKKSLSLRQGRVRGFALIASLTLMLLLGLIAVGILWTLQSQNRMSAHAVLQAEARQQALIGLDAAIADLQVELGPDQRVTASSGILGASSGIPQHILGVWNSWTAPLYASIDGATISSTYGEGRSKMFRRWLISSTDSRQLSRLENIRNLGSHRSGSRALLVGAGTLGNSENKESYIYADLISMPASGNNEGCFAWWVGGENQKANICIKDRPAATDALEILRRTWDTPGPLFSASKSLSFLRQNISEPEKLLTIDSVPLVTRAAMSSGKSYFFDVTTCSYSLPTNVRDGGLKHDLNLLLNKRSLTHTEFAARSEQDCPLAEGEGLPHGTESHMPIGSWQVLHAYYNTWPDGSGSDTPFSARLVGSVSKAHSRMSGLLEKGTTKWGDAVTYYDTRSPEGDRSVGYANTPVLLAFLGAYGLALGKPYLYGGASHGTTYAPFCLWWNPYNVPMHVPAKKVWLMSLPYRTASTLLSDSADNNRWNRYINLQSVTPPVDGNGSIGQKNGYGNDWGNYLVNSLSDQESDIIFAPGEIIAFSMGEGWNNLEKTAEGDNSAISYSQPQVIPFIVGDHAGMLNNYFNSLYSYGNVRSTQILRVSLETRDAYANSRISTVVDSGDGEMSNGKVFDTAGDVFGPGEREAFVVMHGFDGIDASSARQQNVTMSRQSSKVYRLLGAGGISPHHFSLGWYDYDRDSAASMTFLGPEQGFQWNEAMLGALPSYFMAMGVVPKSINAEYNEGFPRFKGKDYRTKVWQHSSPAMGSSHIYRPDDQQRQYHPFQLATIEMGTGLSRGALDTPNDRNGVYGLSSIGGGGGEGVSFISVLELPVHPPFSLAGFAGMRLSPGWYESSGGDTRLTSLARMRRMQYQAGVPGVGLGNSFADPCIPADDVYAFHESNISSSLSSNGRLFSDFFDHAFIINDALWDRWFCSSISDMPTQNGKREAREVLTDFLSGREPLPVSRYKRVTLPQSEQVVLDRILADDGWKVVARYLMVEGGFNVNSVSEEAWTAILCGLAKRDLVSNAGGTLHKVEKKTDEVLFSRFMVSTAEHSIDGGYNVVEGSAYLRPDMKLATAWGEIRALSPEAIRELAREMVKKVRERGPFLNMADFINRRLDGGSDSALTGALQAAIDATDINDVFRENSYNVNVVKEGNLYRYPKAEEGSMYTAAPGYLIQSDVLASLGNILTVRDDTFVVRSYGCVRNPRGAVLAQAWCEAVVQRTMEYVDPANAPEDAADNAGRRSASGKKLSDINKLMGRRFRIISFKWLDHWDI